MNTEKKIEMICTYYECDFINRFHSYYFDSLTIEDELSPENFIYLMEKYGISKKELVNKGVAISNSEHVNDNQGLLDFQVRKQIDKIGKSENKNKNGKSYTYVRNPGTLHKKALSELFRNALPIPAPPFVSLQNALTLSRGSTIVQFLQKKQIVEKDIFAFESIEKLKESLRKLSDLELCELLKLLQTNGSVYDDEDLDVSAYFYEESPLENLLLLKRILQIDELDIEDIQSICILFKYLIVHPELNMDKLQRALSKRRKNKHILNSTYELSATLFPDSVSSIDEYTLRYWHIPELLSQFNNYDIYITFYNMNKSIWDIIRFTLRSFKNPSGKSVINYFQKFGI